MALVRVWDLPTRVFHWALVAAVVTLVITGNIGGNWMVWHMRAGYLVGALLLFRLVWGLGGGHWSRFSTFVPTPVGLWRYLKGDGQPHPPLGHNPLGALSVLAMLTLLTLQVASGLVSDDEIAFTGPLYALVSGQVSSWATWYHKDIGKLGLVALVVLHLLALAYYRVFKQRRLVSAMLSGDQETPQVSPRASDDSWATRLLAVALFAACMGLMVWVASMGQGF
ncbi:MAG: cytochrome b/b6 domain-containing protein [Burkholderiaceae bacterium]|nr:cytochrome b/b6 domain-containing protein [Burkholderiaceae bacterium]